MKYFALAVLLLITPVAFADALTKADEAVTTILFEYDGSEEFASYKVDEDGSVDVVFASNTPESLYDEIVTRLQNHPDVRSVLAGRGGPVCKLF